MFSEFILPVFWMVGIILCVVRVSRRQGSELCTPVFWQFAVLVITKFNHMLLPLENAQDQINGEMHEMLKQNVCGYVSAEKKKVVNKTVRKL